MHPNPSNRACLPAWVFSFPEWAVTTYLRGLLLAAIGTWARLPWLTTIGHMLAYFGGVVLNGLYRIATTQMGECT